MGFIIYIFVAIVCGIVSTVIANSKDIVVLAGFREIITQYNWGDNNCSIA